MSEGNSLLVLDPDAPDPDRPLQTFTFPRQRRDRRLCLADFFKPRSSGELDVVAFQLVTMGPQLSGATAELFAANAYREYLELHGLSVQLAESLAEYWHHRVREELGIDTQEPDAVQGLFDVEYRGCRYSFGYPACPDLEDRAKLVPLLAAGPNRRRAVGGVPAAPGAVHRRAGGPPPGGELFQCPLTHATSPPDICILRRTD